MRRVYKDKYASLHWSAARTKSARGPADKPRMNRLPTAGFVPPSVYIGFPVFVLAKERSGQLCPRYPGGLEGRLASGPPDPSASRSARPRRALPPRHAPRRPGPPVVCVGFGFVRFIQGMAGKLSNPKPGHPTGEVECGGERRDEAGRGQARRGRARRGRARRGGTGAVETKRENEHSASKRGRSRRNKQQKKTY